MAAPVSAAAPLPRPLPALLLVGGGQPLSPHAAAALLSAASRAHFCRGRLIAAGLGRGDQPPGGTSPLMQPARPERRESLPASSSLPPPGEPLSSPLPSRFCCGCLSPGGGGGACAATLRLRFARTPLPGSQLARGRARACGRGSEKERGGGEEDGRQEPPLLWSGGRGLGELQRAWRRWRWFVLEGVSQGARPGGA